MTTDLRELMTERADRLDPPVVDVSAIMTAAHGRVRRRRYAATLSHKTSPRPKAVYTSNSEDGVKRLSKPGVRRCGVQRRSTRLAPAATTAAMARTGTRGTSASTRSLPESPSVSCGPAPTRVSDSSSPSALAGSPGLRNITTFGPASCLGPEDASPAAPCRAGLRYKLASFS